MTNSQRLREARKKREEGTLERGSSSYSNSDKLQKLGYERNIGFDTFESDLRTMGDTINGIYNGWQTQETMQNTRAAVEKMHQRIGAVQAYQNKYGSLGIDAEGLLGGYQSVLDDWDTLAGTYGYYQNADAFNTAKKKDEMDKRFAGLTFEGVQEQLKQFSEDSDEYKYLSNYTGYSNLKDYDKAIEAEKNRVTLFDPKRGAEALKNKEFIQDQKDKMPRIVNGSGIVANNQLKGYVGSMFPDAKTGDPFRPDFKTGNAEYISELEKNRRIHALDNAFDLYEDYKNADDFAEKSQYVSSGVEESKDLWGKTQKTYGDNTYEYINNVDGARDVIKTQAMKVGGFQNAFGGANLNDQITFQEKKGYDYLEPEEVGVYNYLHAYDKENGTNKANEFLESMEVTLSRRMYGELATETEAFADSGFLPSVALAAITVPAKLAGAIPSAVGAASDKILGKETNPYSYYNLVSNFATDARQYVGENIEEETDWEIAGHNVARFLFDTGMSIADSATGAATMGTAFTPLLGMSAAQQKARELKEAGASEEQIMSASLASGIAEAAFEYVGIDNLFKIKNVDGVKNAVKSVLKQMGAEGLEEFGTEVANMITDEMVLGDDSELAKMREELLARGFSEEEVNKKMRDHMISQVAWAFAGGALSGGVMGTGASAIQYKGLSDKGKEIRANDRVDEMMKLAMTPDESEAYNIYNKYAKKGVTGETIKNAQLGNLYAATYDDAKSKLDSKKSDVEEKIDAYMKLSALGEVDTSKPEAERKIKQRASELNKGEETTVNGTATKLEGIRVEDGSTTVLTASGEAKAEDMTFAPKDAEILAYAESLGTEKGSLYVSQYDGKMEASEYENAFSLAYSIGESQLGLTHALDRIKNLNVNQISEIYKAGRQAKVTERQNAITAIQKKYTAKQFYKGTVNDSAIDYTNSGKGEVNWDSLTSGQKENVELAKALYTGLGINLRLTTKGVEGGYDGYYDPKNNEIVMDVYAGVGKSNIKDAELAIVTKSSHELTHWMEDRSPETYAKLKDHIFATLAMKDGKSDEQRIREEIARIKERAVLFNRKTGDITPEYAISEIVARGCEDMLAMSDLGKEALSRLTVEERKSFFAKAKEILQDMISYISEILGRYKSKSKEAVALQEYQDRLKEQLKLWEQGMRESIALNQSVIESGSSLKELLGQKMVNGISEDGTTIVGENREALIEEHGEDVLKYSDKDSEYENAEDSELYEYAQDILNGEKKWKPYVLSNRISERFAFDIKRIIGISVDDYGNEIHPSEIEHINARHGKNGQQDHSMADLHELARIQYVIDNYTNIREGDRSHHFRNADRSYARTVLLQAKVNDDYYYVVEAVPDSKRKKLLITSAFKNKKDIFAVGADTNSGPNLNVHDGAQSNISSKDIIPHSGENTTTQKKFADREIDSRTLLTNALESIAQNDDERARLTEYKSNIEKVNALQFKLDTIRSQIGELVGTKDAGRIASLREEAENLEKKINWHDRQLLRLEATEPLKQVVDRVKKLAKQKGREYAKERMDSYKERTEKRAKVESIRKNTIVLRNWLTKNTKDKHIPDDLKEPVKNLLVAIDFASRQTGVDTSDHTKALAEISNNIQEAKEKVELRGNLLALQVAAAKSEELQNLGVDFTDEINGLTDSINNMKLKSDELFVLKDMSLDDLDTLNKIVTTLKTVITRANKYYTMRRQQSITASAHELFDLFNALGNVEEGKLDNVADFFNYENVTPVYFFDRLGEVGKDLFHSFIKAQDKMAFLKKEVQAFADGTWNSKDVDKWDSDLIEFDVVDAKKTVDITKPVMKKVYTTTSRLMTLYLQDQREQSQGHLYKGAGGRFTTFKHKGKIYGEDVDGVLLTPDLVKQMITKLDPKAKEVADRISEFLNTRCQDLGNEISLEFYGVRLFQEQKYIPIEVIEESKSRKADKPIRSITALLNKGFTKEVKPKAKNQIVLDSIFDVFAKHTSEMIAYNSYAREAYDAVRLFEYNENVQTYAVDNNDGHQLSYNIQTAMKGALGKGAVAYFRNFLEDINGTQQAGRGDNMLSKVFSNTKLANVAWNLNVALLQPLSLVRAMTMIKPKYLGWGILGIRDGIKQAKEHSGTALWKSYGFYDTDISRGLAEQIKNNKTFGDKLKEASMKAPEVADKLSWGVLWKACEHQVAANNNGLKKGSDEFYDKVVELFEETVYRTQVIDSVLARSQITRSKSGIVKGLTSYMAEPLVTYNMVYGIFSQWNIDSRTGHTFGDCLKKHGKKIAVAVGVYCLSSGLEAAIRTLTTSMRNAGGDDDEDENVFLEQVLDAVNPLSKIPIGREVSSVLQGYGVSTIPGLDTIEVFNDAYKQILKIFVDGEEVSYKKVHKILKAVSYGTGHGVSNAYRDIVAIWNSTIGQAYPSMKIK